MLINDLIAEGKASTNSKEIFQTPSIACDRTSNLKVATLVAGKDIEMLLWCLKSLFYYSDQSWDLWILDGGLNDSDEEILKAHFPAAHICRDSELASSVVAHLTGYAQAYEFRGERGHALAKKIIDVSWLLRPHKFLLVDSDVLFFQNPGDLIERLSQDQVSRFAFSLDSFGINAGVAIVPSSLVSFSKIDAVLGSMPPVQKGAWGAEQDIYAALSKDCFDELPYGYVVEGSNRGQAYSELVCCHFIYVSRHRFYTQGVRQLRNTGFIDGLRSRYSR
jgi:hypothetical protein